MKLSVTKTSGHMILLSLKILLMMVFIKSSESFWRDLKV